MKLDLICATLKWSGYRECLESWSRNTLREWRTRLMENDLSGDSLMESYQMAFEESGAEVLGYIHDDVIVHDPNWYQRVMKEFDDPTVGLVGFGGALSHGAREMYKTPYELPQLGRGTFLSNMREAEVHGKRFTEECDVAVLDGFVLFVRRELLIRCGGWPLNTSVGYIGYDYHVSCMARRYGYRIRLVGVACDHLSGKSTGLNPKLGNANFEEAHLEIYNEFRDVLPFEIK